MRSCDVVPPRDLVPPASIGREQQEAECARLLHDVHVTRNQSNYVLEGVVSLRSTVAHKLEARAEFAFSSLRSRTSGFIAQVLGQGSQKGVIMPKLERSQWYDLSRDLNWHFKYVKDEEVFLEALSHSHGIPQDAWWGWDEPYKISYREYVHNQAEKDAGVYSVRSVIARSRLFENLDPSWKAAI